VKLARLSASLFIGTNPNEVVQTPAGDTSARNAALFAVATA
jgi:hypothetical protein